MSDALELLSSLKSPKANYLIIADEQSKGIGRNNNEWLSPQGGLWFTYCFKSEFIAHQITLLMGLCLHQVLTEKFPCLKNKLLIKWPNDLIFDNKKLSGILIQSHSGYICTGIGINTNIDAICLDVPLPPVSLKHILGFDVSNSSIMSSFLVNFYKKYQIFRNSGILPYINEINSLLYGLNKTITFDNDKEIVKGICRGISEEGAIILELDDGQVSYNYSGSIINCSD